MPEPGDFNMQELPEALPDTPKFDRVANAIAVLMGRSEENATAIVQAIDRLSAATLAARMVKADDSVGAIEAAVAIASRALGIEG